MAAAEATSNPHHRSTNRLMKMTIRTPLIVVIVAMAIVGATAMPITAQQTTDGERTEPLTTLGGDDDGDDDEHEEEEGEGEGQNDDNDGPADILDYCDGDADDYDGGDCVIVCENGSSTVPTRQSADGERTEPLTTLGGDDDGDDEHEEEEEEGEGQNDDNDGPADICDYCDGDADDSDGDDCGNLSSRVV